MAKILVVEDDPHILRVISLWLTRQGHEVIEARNGQAALELVRAQRPDVLITDVNMPLMDGLQLVEQVVQDVRAPRGIVLLTNRWDHGEMSDRFTEWHVHVLPKPFSPSKLSVLVKLLIENPAAAETQPASGHGGEGVWT